MAAERKPVFYMAHPVTGDIEENVRNAIKWIRWLTLEHPDRVYIAPWIAEVQAFLTTKMTPEFYDRVLSDDEEVVRHCDGILLVGGRISVGMARECDAAIAARKPMIDWHEYRSPADVPAGRVPMLPTPGEVNQ